MALQEFTSCIEACDACALACLHCAASCLDEDDPGAMARCIKLDLDCAALCRVAADAMARGSEHAEAICALCADVCEACAQECEQHEMDHCQDCAEACDLCAQACRGMSEG
ncbi:MAG: four-helix bundle copper-binding protein [Acidobacteriota bacterium]